MSPFEPFPTLATPRLQLRCPSLGDLEPMFRQATDPRVIKHVWRAPAASIEVTRAKLELILENLRKGDGVAWTLASPGDGSFLGTAALWRWDKPNFRVEIGYDLVPEAWGQGLVTEALEPVLRFGFEQMGLHSVEAHVHPDNVGSIRVLEKHGFRKEAHLRESVFHPVLGVFQDAAIYSLIHP